MSTETTSGIVPKRANPLPRLQAMPQARVAEHIVLSTEEPESDESPPEVKRGAVRTRYEINNRLRRYKTEVVLYEGGYLGVRKQRGGRSSNEILLDLRYLDPLPARARFNASRARRAALCLSGVAALCIGLAGLSVFAQARIGIPAPAAAAAFLAAAVAWLGFLRQLRERAVFRTRRGAVPVWTLLSNFGCFRSSRALLPAVTDAIVQAQRSDAKDPRRRLREEIREHYRLRDIGVLSAENCRQGTLRVLRHFDHV